MRDNGKGTLWMGNLSITIADYISIFVLIEDLIFIKKQEQWNQITLPQLITVIKSNPDKYYNLGLDLIVSNTLYISLIYSLQAFVIPTFYIKFIPDVGSKIYLYSYNYI